MIRNIAAVVIGIFVGGIVNMSIISIGPQIIPLPEGVDPSDMEQLAESMPSWKPVNFLCPFLAHSLGTLVGAILAAAIAGSRKILLATCIGAFFLIGGIMMVLSLPSPIWFNVADLVIAYIPMGYLGGILGGRLNGPAEKLTAPSA